MWCALYLIIFLSAYSFCRNSDEIQDREDQIEERDIDESEKAENSSKNTNDIKSGKKRQRQPSQIQTFEELVEFCEQRSLILHAAKACLAHIDGWADIKWFSMICPSISIEGDVGKDAMMLKGTYEYRWKQFLDSEHNFYTRSFGINIGIQWSSQELLEMNDIYINRLIALSNVFIERVNLKTKLFVLLKTIRDQQELIEVYDVIIEAYEFARGILQQQFRSGRIQNEQQNQHEATLGQISSKISTVERQRIEAAKTLSSKWIEFDRITCGCIKIEQIEQLDWPALPAWVFGSDAEWVFNRLLRRDKGIIRALCRVKSAEQDLARANAKSYETEVYCEFRLKHRYEFLSKLRSSFPLDTGFTCRVRQSLFSPKAMAFSAKNAADLNQAISEYLENKKQIRDEVTKRYLTLLFYSSDPRAKEALRRIMRSPSTHVQKILGDIIRSSPISAQKATGVITNSPSIHAQEQSIEINDHERVRAKEIRRRDPLDHVSAQKEAEANMRYAEALEGLLALVPELAGIVFLVAEPLPIELERSSLNVVPYKGVKKFRQ